MYKIRILTIGKIKEAWLKAGLDEYEKRLSKNAEIVWVLARNDEQLASLAASEKEWIAIDPAGLELDSGQFSGFLLKQLECGGSRLSFLIGGAEGIPEPLKKRSSSQISLSKMTFTHQMTRLVLLEQIYRAIEIAKGSGYHKA